MKNFLLSFFVFCFISGFVPFFGFGAAFSETLKASINVDEYVPKGFMGSWGVISKLVDTTNPMLFNLNSKDIWVLSGYSNVLVLENPQSGAISSITLKDKAQNNVLKFERQKIENKKDGKKVVFKEKVEFILKGKFFSGYDTFIVEQYKNNKLIKKDSANYHVEGVRISGQNPSSYLLNSSD